MLEHTAYLNAGTSGPVPARGVAAAEESLTRQLEQGRGGHTFFEAMFEMDAELRARVAGLVNCGPEELIVTGATTDGINAALLALDLRPGDEVLTSDEEHPGLLAPLAVARESRGIRVRVVPFAELPGEIRPDTRLVACSHVSWVSGRVMDTSALAASAATVLLDGAQGLGAVAVDVVELGCDFYAASGQKWLCGPNGLGYLYVRPELGATLNPPWPGYHVLEDPSQPLQVAVPSRTRAGSAPASVRLISSPSPSAPWTCSRRPASARSRAGPIRLAGILAERLAEQGREVSPRDETTLVTFTEQDAEGFVERALAAGVVVRSFPTPRSCGRRSEAGRTRTTWSGCSR